jgi:SP family general alpha glucoside:H+ symporter-like MFS transporter
MSMQVLRPVGHTYDHFVLYYYTTSDLLSQRGIFVGQWVFAAIAIPFTPFMPESPWWLSRKGRQAEALHSLRRLGYTVLDAENHLAFIQLTDAKAREETSGTSYFGCFRKANRRRTWITVMPLTVQALSGVAFISGYSTYYFQLAGLTVKRSFELSCAAQGLSIAGNIASWFIIDRVGRRPLIVYGMWFLTALLLVTGGLATSSEPNLLLGTVGLIMFYNFAFNIVIGAVAYTIIAEIPTARLRTKTIAISITIQQAIYTIEIFVLPYIFNPDQANLGAKTAFIFGGFSVICCMVLWIFMPETANRSFQEIDEMFFHQVPPRKFKTYVTQTQSSAADLHSDVKTEDIDCV